MANGWGCCTMWSPRPGSLRCLSMLTIPALTPNCARCRVRRAAAQPSRDALRHHALEHPAQGIALAKAVMSCAAEHRMVGDTVLDTELAEPTVGKVHLHLSADTPLRADRKHVTNDQHPDHQYRIDRGSACMRVIRCKLLVHPIQVEHRIDLPD